MRKLPDVTLAFAGASFLFNALVDCFSQSFSSRTTLMMFQVEVHRVSDSCVALGQLAPRGDERHPVTMRHGKRLSPAVFALGSFGRKKRLRRRSRLQLFLDSLAV